ncbi:MAG: glycosyltransferase family 39 protein [Candidatus Peribacteraceae bacterium]|nr:glycosyltransferase family 39 protein [Candidatus Peribacteraceae bacterium]
MQLSVSRRSLVLVSAIILTGMFLLYAQGTRTLTPSYSAGTYRLKNTEAWQPFEMPLAYSSEETQGEVRFSMRVGRGHAGRFRIAADDCINALWVNGTAVKTDLLPTCDFTKGKALLLGPLLHEGTNQIRATVRNFGGPGTFSITVAGSDPVLLGLRILLLAAIALTSLVLACVFRVTGWNAVLWAGLSSGILLRLIYLFVTPHDLRGHDTEGHFEYIRFIVEHWALPGAKEGWEFYHPPLYYALSALWVGIGQFFARPLPLLWLDLQWHALFASVLSLLLGVWMASMIFPRKEEGRERALFVCLLAVFPSLVFFAARINNDVLLALLEYLAFALLLYWWQKGGTGIWFALTLVIAAAMLTKSNALLLLPIAFGCLFVRQGWIHRKKIITGIISLFIILTLTTWNFTLRDRATEGHPIMPNITNLNTALRVDNGLETLMEFNPARVILHPYNNAWDDESGRSHFWEYYFRSAFFGEFDFGAGLQPLASAILTSTLLLLPFLLLGIWEAFRRGWRRTFPFWFSAAVLLAGHIAFRQSAPFSTSQDFRYSILLIVPIGALMLMGISRSPPLLQKIAIAVTALLCVFCAIFLTSLIFA